MTEEGETKQSGWELLPEFTTASFVNNSEDSSRKNIFKYPVLKECINPLHGGSNEDVSENLLDGETRYPNAEKVELINSLHGSSSGDLSETVVELPPSIPANLHVSGEEDAADLFAGSSSLVKVASVDNLSSVVAEIVGADGQAIQIKPRRSKRFKAFWSITIATSVVGIVVLVHSLQAALQQNQQLQQEILAKDEKLDDLLHQVGRLKEVLTNHFIVKGSGL